MPTVATTRRAVPDENRTQHQAWARTLGDAFRRAHRSTTAPQTDRRVMNLTKRVEKGTVKLLEHLIMFARNWFERGASQEAVEGIGHVYLAIVRRWYSDERPALTLAALAKAETVAQAAGDVEQWDLTEPTPQVIAEAEEALSIHLTQLSRLVWRLREMRYAQR